MSDSVSVHYTELLVCWVPVAPQDIKFIDTDTDYSLVTSISIDLQALNHACTSAHTTPACNEKKTALLFMQARSFALKTAYIYDTII